MGVLKVVSVWYGCWHECGLIIWGFIHLGTVALIFVFFSIIAFIGVELNYGFI